MARIDWTEEEQAPRLTVKEGDHVRVRVASCEEKKSKEKGHAYFSVAYVSMEHPGSPFVCFDTIMLEGRGRSIGLAKLKALGFSERPEIAAAELEGLEVIIKITHEEYEGKPKRRVAFEWSEGEGDTPHWRAGYWSVGWPAPPMPEEESEETSDHRQQVDETPF